MKTVSQKKAVIAIILIFIIGIFMGITIERNVIPAKFIPALRIFSIPEAIDADFDYNLFWKVWSSIKEKHVAQPVSDEDLFYGSIKGLVQGLDDPYSVFLEPDLAKKFLEDISGSFEGVGIEIGIKDNRLTVIAPLPYTPAYRAGLRAGDKIFAIDEKDTIGMSLDEVVHLIRGPKGTPVTLTIWRDGDKRTQDIEIIRDVIEIKTVSWELKGNNIAYIQVSHFSEETWKDFQDIAHVVLRANPNGLIIDLRNNPGGFLDTAVNMAGYWISKDVVTISRDAQDKEVEYKSSGRGDFSHLDTIVLVNQGSASASEILAGSLQDYKEGTVLGEQTFGKGSVQELESYRDGSALKITIARWYTPLGRSIHDEGITPDIEVEMTSEDYDLKRDPQIDRALEILGGTPPTEPIE
ncbi:S41 family peptidase [Patescibacteria group bacterium AH-259-L07]|nr:S41 family peptidase [Patescibacteria group bacterium AH-259-L07]